MNPEFAKAWDNLGTLLATCPDAAIRDPRQAVAAAHKACELTSLQDWNFLNTLASAYAAAGDFNKARDWSKQAEAKAPAAQKPSIRRITEAYESGESSRQ